MKSFEVLNALFNKSAVRQIADALNLSPSAVYKWGEPTGPGQSGTANPLQRVADVVRVSHDDAPARWLANQAGGFFVRNPEPTHPVELIPAMNEVVRDFSDLLGAISGSSSDSRISEAEAQAIRARWELLKSVTEGFVQGCESGSFEPRARA